MKKTIPYFFILIISVVFSQEKNNPFIESMNDRLSIKIDLDNNIEIIEYKQGNLAYEIKPNLDYKLELGAHYKFISVKFGISPHLLSDYNEDLKGKTKKLSFKADFHFKKWIQNFSYNNTKGFYIPNYPINNNQTINIKLPNQKIIHYSGTTKYKFNDNYSIKALTTQTEIQRISAGTFLPKLQYTYSLYKNDDSPQQIKTLHFILSSGYLHTFVLHEKIYLGIGVAPGVGINYYELTTKQNTNKFIENGNEFTFNFDGFIGLGYNSKHFFGGIYCRSAASTINEVGSLNFSAANTHLQVFLGYRFKTPKFLKKQVDEIEKKSPF